MITVTLNTFAGREIYTGAAALGALASVGRSTRANGAHEVTYTQPKALK